MLLRLLLSAFVFLQFTISIDVDLVVFNVTVLNSGGQPYTGLTEGDFKVYEDGKEQAIKVFQPEDTPSTVGLLIDNSGSMSTKTREVVSAALAFLDASHPSNETFIVDFNYRPWFALPASVPFTSDRAQLRAALMETKAQGTTALYDALAMGFQQLKKGTRQRKAIVILSDGGDNGSHTSLDEALLMAQQSSATIYCIGIYDPFTNRRDRNPGVLRRIAKVGGGEAFFPATTADLQKIWPRIAGAIRGEYTIGYFSSNPARDGSYRNVRIVASVKKGKALDLRTRPGYYAPTSPSR